MYQLQKEIEFKFSKKNIKNVIRAEVDPEHKIIQNMVQTIDVYRNKVYGYKSKNERVSKLNKLSDDIAEELAVAVLGLKDVSPIQVVVTQLANFLNYKVYLDGVKTAAEIIAVCAGELYSLYHSTDQENETGTLGIKPHYEPSKLVQEFIANTKYLPPMLVKPLDWKENNNSGGYLDGSGSILLGDMNHHNENQALDVINILQSIEWELNTSMLEFEEVSKKELDTHEKKSNFNRIRDTSEEVYRDLLEQGNKFYFVWKYDFRGRSYSSGFHINIQGNSYRKSLLNFKHKEVLTEEIVI